jgi:hypothetical protein
MKIMLMYSFVLFQDGNFDKKQDSGKSNTNNLGTVISGTFALDEEIVRRPGSLTSSSYNEFGDMATFLYRLRASFDQLCETYVDVVLDKDGQHSAVDRIADQPIFFLIAQPNDFPEIRRKEYLPRASVTSTATNISIEEKKEFVSMMETVKSHGDTALCQDEVAGEKSSQNLVRAAEDTIQNDLISDGNVSVMVERESPVDSGDEDVFEEPTEMKDDKTSARPFVLADFVREPLYSTSDSETDMRVENAPEKDHCGDEGDAMEDAVYEVAGEKDVANLMGEYKRRKQTRSMPQRKNPFCAPRTDSSPLGPPLPSQPVPPEVEEQRRNSLYRVSHLSTLFNIQLL